MHKQRWSGLLLWVAAGCAHAQVTIPQEYDKTVQATSVIGALGPDLAGESVSFYNGALSFSAVDVSLTGNNALPVEARRRYSVESRTLGERNRLLTRSGGFADWELDVPYLHGVFGKNLGWQVDGWNTAGKELRCSLAQANMAEPPLAMGAPLGQWAASEYWQGNHLHIPGAGDQEMLVVDVSNPHRPTDGKAYPWVTGNQWFFSCLTETANGAAGEAFLAVDPQGNRYWFNWFARRDVDTITKTTTTAIDAFSAGAGTASAAVAPGTSGSALTREEVRIFATRVEDRFGNSVSYNYDPAVPWRLLSIVSSDGRQLNFTYNSAGHISSLTDGYRTWTYVYGNGLTEVVLPDASKWQIDFSNLRLAYTAPYTGSEVAMCSLSGSAPVQSVYSGAITHPSGARVDFKVQSVEHGRSYVPKLCMKPAGLLQPNDYAKTPYLFNTVAIIEKKISGPGIATPYVWSYAYGPASNSWAADCSSGCVDSKTVTVTGPGEWMRYTFGNRFRSNEGMLLKVETGESASVILNIRQTTYQLDSTGQLYPASIGQSPYARGDGMSERHVPERKKVTTQQGRNFVWEVPAVCGPNETAGTQLCFDRFGRPTKVAKSSVPSQ